jgi:hypothetical protein
MDVASFWSDEQNFDSYFRYIKYPIESIHFPATIDRILMRNMFSPISISHYTGDSVYKNYESLTKVYVSSNTVIEDGAFTPEIEIIRY